MNTQIALSKELAAALLKQLRPIDVSLGIKVLLGSPLKPRPSLQELVEPDARIFWLAALTNYAQGQAHSGLYLDSSSQLIDLLDAPEQEVPELSLSLVDLLGEGDTLCREFPEQVVSAEDLENGPKAYFVYRPESRLIYLQRWYRMEAKVGAFVRERLARPASVLPDHFASTFQEFFPVDTLSENPWQAAASFAALRHDFTVITGGPGTGKTTTVTRLLGLLMSLPEGGCPKSIRMVAPTGKAADRLRESIAENFDQMLTQLPEARRAGLKELKEATLFPASTIHAFLGSMGSHGFRYNAGNPVTCDVLIVDECSMVDLELFIALLDALPRACRIVLLGDKNQLAAVGTGNVFTDLTGTTETTYGNLNACSDGFREDFALMSDCPLPRNEDAQALCQDQVVELTKSYRFTGDSEVGRLACLLLDHERLPKSGELDLDCTHLEMNWRARLKQALAAFKEALATGQGPAELLDVIGKVRILCAVRQGEHGVEAINRLLAEYVLGSGVSSVQPQDGLPFIVRSNDKTLGLYNGDCGIFRIDSQGELAAYLPALNAGESLRRFNPFALPDWESAFALTIHKSQGSEYESIVVVLPEMKRRFISWELVYTAITRGKRSVSLVLPQALLGQTLARVQRRSGLREELLEGPND